LAATTKLAGYLAFYKTKTTLKLMLLYIVSKLAEKVAAMKKYC
jgi:hypothetical protein